MKPILKFPAFVLISGLLIALSCKKETSCEGCATKNNKPPIAVAGPDQVITLPTDSVLLDGRNSSDPDGMISGWLWKKISGPASFNVIKPTDSITKVKALNAGTYLFELKVTDNGGLSDKDTLQIFVNDSSQPNRPPLANAGSDTTITLPNSIINLNGSRSNDPENNITGYVWTKISGPSSFSIINANAVQAQVVNLVEGNYQFELEVTDAAGLSSRDTMKAMVLAAIPGNAPPVANSGPDINANYDLQSCTMNPEIVTLNGSASFDPDGTIQSYLWTGPGTISNANAAVIQISNCSLGINMFILKVTDNHGAIDMDTVIVKIGGINRTSVAAQLVPFDGLSIPRAEIVSAGSGNKILFAGGWTGLPYSTGSAFTTRVDIYDISTNTWSTAELSQPRVEIGVAVAGDKIFFAGGTIPIPWGGAWGDAGYRSSRIDIYDVSNNTWSTSELSVARGGVMAASAGNRVLFAGGHTHFDDASAVVDIFNLESNSWTTTSLTQRRFGGAATVIDNKIYFAGGLYTILNDVFEITSRIDIYDASSNIWSISELNQARLGLAGIAAGSKNYWAGGDDNTVEIRDENAQTSSLFCLFQPNSWFDAVKKNNRVIFFTGRGEIRNKFDIYDFTNASWTIGVLNQVVFGAAIISFNNTVYVAGGYVNGALSGQVWKLEL